MEILTCLVLDDPLVCCCCMTCEGHCNSIKIIVVVVIIIIIIGGCDVTYVLCKQHYDWACNTSGSSVSTPGHRPCTISSVAAAN